MHSYMKRYRSKLTLEQKMNIRKKDAVAHRLRLKALSVTQKELLLKKWRERKKLVKLGRLPQKK